MQTNQLDESSQNQNIPIINSIDEYLMLKGLEKFRFYCKSCGKLAYRTKMKDKKSQLLQKRFLCRACGTKQTCLEKYGTEYIFQSDLVKEKIEKTNLERYGHKSPMQSKEILDKVKKTRNYPHTHLK